MTDSNAVVAFLSDPATLVGLGVIAVGTAYYMATRPSPGKMGIPRDNQSVEHAGGARRSHFAEKGQLLEYCYDDAKTLYECFQRGKRVSNDGPCLGWRPDSKSGYQWISYGQVEERAHNFGSGLSHVNIPTGQKTFLGVYSNNCVDWVVTEQSCDCYSRVLVPLYDTLGSEAVAFIINQADISAVVCDKSKIPLLLVQAGSCSTLKTIIKMGDNITEEEEQEASKAGLEIYSMAQIEKFGKENPQELVLPTPDDMASICYTSGTTGNPKGVILTNRNIVSNVAGITRHLGTHFELGPSDVHISYLPLAHNMERTCHIMLLMSGSRIGFFQGDIKLLVADIQELKPTCFISVPRLLNRIYDKVLAGVSSSAVKKWLFETALNAKVKEVNSGITRKNSWWDYLVFRKVQNLLGGQIRFIISGSAPISPRVLDFLRAAFGCLVIEGYGQTECCAGATLTAPGDPESGHVGPPIPSVFVKLADVPDMNYFAANNVGEVCFKGPIVTPGYLKDPEKTKEAIDEDGWLHSGDIGKWLPNGVLKITDRKKHIFKLAQGEYIAPEKIENVYGRSEFVAQTFLYGDSLKSCCVAIIIPDEEILMAWAAKNGKAGKKFDELCCDSSIQEMILEDVRAVGKREGLNSLEQAKAITLCSEPFSVENGLITPTFKLKRPSLRNRYMEDFVRMYAKLPA